MPAIALDRPVRAEPPAAAPAAEPAIRLDRVTVRFTTERGTVTALEGIDLAVRPGGFVTLLGPSGCGKSTLLRVVADLIPPTSGAVRVLGGTASAARERRDIGFVFQDAALLPWRTALQNVELPLEVGRARPGKRSPRELLELVGLGGWENAFPHELSGGMRQRVSIARALANDPKLLLMDEPFGALDAQTREILQGELIEIHVRTRKTILFVTHDLDEAVLLADRVVVMQHGSVQEIMDVSLPRPRGDLGALRGSAEFADTRYRLWRAINAQPARH